MPPQIEWHVNEDNSKQTIVKTPSTSARRWRLSLIALMIVLGASLGAIYSSVKEPATRPTPTPTITPFPTSTPANTPPSLIETIDREAQALADGDLKTYLSIQDQSDPLWYQSQVRNFRTWGRPTDKQQTILNYTLLEPPRSNLKSVVDIAQYRNGQFFRETRFYRKVNDHWLHTQPDASFWSGRYEKLRSQHFNAIYPLEDNELISTTIERFEWTYNLACADLNCPSHLTDTPIELFVQLEPDGSESVNPNQQVAIWIHSPRILGFYETDVETARQLDDPILHATTENLIPHLVQVLAGGYERWPGNGPSPFYPQAIIDWETNRLSAKPDMIQLLPPSSLASDLQLAKLESLWTMQSVPSNPEQVANSVIFFIEQKYGVESVGKFLEAIGPANSFKEAIKNSLGVDEIQFEQQWKDWLKQRYAQGS